MLQSICLWGLNLLWILAIIYAIIRTIRLYRSKSEIYETSLIISKQLQPQFLLLQQEIADLRQEIQDLKENPALAQENPIGQLLTHD